MDKRRRENMLRRCKYCGLEANNEEQLDNFVRNKGAIHNRKPLCKVCDSKRQRERTKKFKLECLSYLGDGCSVCNIKVTYNNTAIFDFHHIDESTKEFSVGNSGKNFIKVKTELDKCIILCANCHRLEHEVND